MQVWARLYTPARELLVMERTSGLFPDHQHRDGLGEDEVIGSDRDGLEDEVLKIIYYLTKCPKMSNNHKYAWGDRKLQKLRLKRCQKRKLQQMS